ncbi:hypothetical protein C8R44DRAFT_806177 [Mycena epipterygia]|nr:hypothetical protein C8R44DRAFT_806177 [Mycena epipterygia]
MIDITYIVLIAFLVATNLSRIFGVLLWLFDYLSRSRNPPLVPYFDRQGELIGMVRLTASDLHTVDERNFIPNTETTSQNREIIRASARSHSAQTVTSSAVSTPWDTAPAAWNGWPDGRFKCLFSQQEVTDTHQLAMYWVCEVLPGRRGSPAALTWQKGKEMRRKCIGVIVCSSRSCPAGLQIAPAIRGYDLHRQLQKRCTCGDTLRLQPCGIESSLFLFRGGAYFINSGDHTHFQFTHSLIYRAHEPFDFAEYISQRPLVLHDRTAMEESDAPSVGSDSNSNSDHSEWNGIESVNDPVSDRSQEEWDSAELEEINDDPEANKA